MKRTQYSTHYVSSPHDVYAYIMGTPSTLNPEAEQGSPPDDISGGVKRSQLFKDEE
ncbi:hypothetical protein [Candidatus Cardinium hertigii]|uniref:hypothetical protein n=1 Tax=Candidatus Cardinium hertigii TaxID=247481 RepID=UPI00161DC1B8|nr:hypothetical protein [Candidatus Cardinium hertigii]